MPEFVTKPQAKKFKEAMFWNKNIASLCGTSGLGVQAARATRDRFPQQLFLIAMTVFSALLRNA